MSGHDAELERMRAGVSCAVLLERHPPPWQLDQRESTRNCLKYRRAKGEILLVTHGGRGWWDPCSVARGDVFALVRHLEPGLTFGEVRKVLRPFIGLSPSYPAHERRTGAKQQPIVPFALRWERRPVPVEGSPAWGYLTQARGLLPSIVSAAIDVGVLREGPHATAWFGHRDHDGQLTGIEMRGPDYRGFSTGGNKTLFRLHAPGWHPSGGVPLPRLVVAEAPIDAMSVAKVEGLRADTLYAATAGGIGPATIQALELQLGDLVAIPHAVLVAASDADRAGVGYAARLAAMARTAGVQFERLPPPNGCKDWNDAIRQAEAT